MNSNEQDFTGSVRIALSQGLTTLIDGTDTAWVTQWKWSARENNRGIFYACRVERVDGRKKFVHLHRAVYEMHHGPIAHDLEIDHINHDSLDNRLSNLRAVTRSLNNANREAGRHERKHSLPKGVYPSKARFRAQIGMNGRALHLGCFGTAEEAHQAFKTAWEKLYAH